VSQPAPLSQGQTTVVPQSDVKVEEERGGLALVGGGVALKDLVDGLNRLGVSPRDMISMLQALKAAGAIQAEIEVMSWTRSSPSPPSTGALLRMRRA